MSKKEKQVTVGVCGLPKHLVDALRARAKENNRSLSGEIRAIVETYVIHNSKEAA
jgi:plasmid stability protein